MSYFWRVSQGLFARSVPFTVSSYQANNGAFPRARVARSPFPPRFRGGGTPETHKEAMKHSVPDGALPGFVREHYIREKLLEWARGVLDRADIHQL